MTVEHPCAAQVSFLSFVLPPYLHLRLTMRQNARVTSRTLSPGQLAKPTGTASVFLDSIATVLGVVIVVFTTTLTALTTATELNAAAARAMPTEGPM